MLLYNNILAWLCNHYQYLPFPLLNACPIDTIITNIGHRKYKE